MSRKGISMSDWCQNPKCPEKKNQNQIRGSKGAKYYQSNKANEYGNGNFCTLGCRTEWDNEYMDRAIDALGIRIHKAVKINVEDAWYVKTDYTWSTGDCNYLYFLVNKNKGIKQPITREQAQSPEDIQRGYDYIVIGDTQAKELAIELGLAS